MVGGVTDTGGRLILSCILLYASNFQLVGAFSLILMSACRLVSLPDAIFTYQDGRTCCHAILVAGEGIVRSVSAADCLTVTTETVERQAPFFPLNMLFILFSYFSLIISLLNCG